VTDLKFFTQKFKELEFKSMEHFGTKYKPELDQIWCREEFRSDSMVSKD
jgi:hypothetical protein